MQTSRQGRRWLLATLVLTALALTSAVDTWAQMPAVRKVRLTYRCEIADTPADAKGVDLWIPMPSDNERQTVKLLNESELGEGRITADKKFGNRLYYRHFALSPAGDGADNATTAVREPIKVELVYDVDVREATVAAAKHLVSTKQVDPGPEFAPYLGDSAMIPLQGRISQLAAGINLPDGEPLRAGRKIYDYLIDTMVYNYLAKGAGTGNAVWACDSKTGDCTDYHSVFIGVCRWRGIPADHVFGLPIPPDKPEGDIKFCHCWARFWVAGVGWIPIDASRADKFPQDREYYFGTLGSTWITLAHGRDVVLDPPQQGKPINMFDEPIAEIDGRTIDHVRWQAHYQDQPEPSEVQ